MKTSITQVLCKTVLFGILAFISSGCAAQGTSSETVTAQDCAKVALQYLDNELLTREEKIALLDQTLLRAVNNIESCPSTSATNNQAVSGGVQGTENATSEGIQETENRVGKAVVESIPASDIQGDAPLPEEEQDEQTIADHETTTREPDKAYRKPAKPNGKLPEDIPEAQSDDIIAQQFRQAAIEETDPEIKARLWNEYRRYKGLPVSETPET